MKLSSYAHGHAGPPLIGQTIGAFFDAVAEKDGDVLALVVRHQNVRWTYRELKAQVDAAAAGFLALGLEPGERVGIWAPNRCEWTITQFATAKAGLVLVNINPAYRTAEAEYALNKVGCKALVLARTHKTSDYLAMLRELAPEIDRCAPGALTAKRLPHLRHVILLDGEAQGVIPFAELSRLGGAVHHARLAELAEKIQFDAPVNIQFTSGTTGFPKGATLSHHNILNNGFFVGEAIRLGRGERLCIPVPLYHCFGMVMGNLGCLTHSAAMVYPSEGFDPLAVLQAIEAEACAGVYGVPTMFIAELNHPDFAKFDLGALRTGIMAGSPCPVEVMKRVVSDMHMSEVTIAYGMTETSPVSLQSAGDDPLDLRVSTVGRVQPHLEVKIIDTNGAIVPRGVTGELCTRGYSVMLGYWDDAERTQEAIDAGRWMHTGDLATMSDDGTCNIVGRIKDLVIRGGENIYPREIEEFLYRHPSVQDVQVVGIPDPKYGEELCAWIVLKAGASVGAEDIQAFCRGQIAHYKVPRHVRFVDGFPTTVTGKVQKFQIRETMIRELGLVRQETA